VLNLVSSFVREDTMLKFNSNYLHGMVTTVAYGMVLCCSSLVELTYSLGG
jgi:hypothetical protein